MFLIMYCGEIKLCVLWRYDCVIYLVSACHKRRLR